MEFSGCSIVRLLKGEASRDEAETILNLPASKLDDYFNEQEWESFQPGILQEEWSSEWYREIKKQMPRDLKRFKWKQWLRAAAILFLFAGGIYYTTGKTKRALPTGKTTSKAHSSIVNQDYIANESDTVRNFDLPDGSLAAISPNSTIRFTNPMEKERRSIWLQGEAIFHVAKDVHRPFTVFTPGLATTAVGTVFKVSSFKNQKTRVVLISGRIKVSNQKNKEVLFLNAGDECSFDPQYSALKMNRIVPEKYLPKKQGLNTVVAATGEISFNKTPLRQVFRQLEATYHVHIELKAEPSDARTFTGSFAKSQLPGEAIETIALLNDLEASRSGDTIYLRRK